MDKNGHQGSKRFFNQNHTSFHSYYHCVIPPIKRAIIVLELSFFFLVLFLEFDTRFRVEPSSQVPFLLYSSHHLFQQTNASPGLISEGTGGLTELIKGRVLLPHVGSWDRLEWVTRHELVHWYMLEKIWHLFEYRVDIVVPSPYANATAVSNFIDVTAWRGTRFEGYPYEVT